MMLYLATGTDGERRRKRPTHSYDGYYTGTNYFCVTGNKKDIRKESTTTEKKRLHNRRRRLRRGGRAGEFKKHPFVEMATAVDPKSATTGSSISSSSSTSSEKQQGDKNNDADNSDKSIGIDIATAAPSSPKPELIWGLISLNDAKKMLVPLLFAIFAALAASGPAGWRWFLSFVWHMLCTIFGVTIGVGFGLGLAMHVYDQLQLLKARQLAQRRSSEVTERRIEDGLSASIIRPTSATILSKQASILEDGTSYTSLMESAGYLLGDKVLRGQIVRNNSTTATSTQSSTSFWKLHYPFTDVPVDEQHGAQLMQYDWPSLPKPIAVQLGRFIDHIMRDYISGWYCKMDSGCIYRDEKEKRLEGQERDGGSTPETEEESLDGKPRKGAPKKNVDSDNNNHGCHDGPQQTQRRMVFSAARYRHIPMLDQTYKVLSVAFGNLAARVEHVNLFSLALLKWTEVLAHTFKVYRKMRKLAVDKLDHGGGTSSKPTEMQVAREFLLAGKLHRAVTFGLDVPSLLFADASGKDFGTGTDESPIDDCQVLEQRLLHTEMLRECELDYNRVLAHRLCRALLPRTETTSTVVTALIVEIFAGCVLQPLMGIFCPLYLNGWIIAGLKDSGNADQGAFDENGCEIIDGAAVQQGALDGNPAGCSEDLASSTSEIASQKRSGTHTQADVVDNEVQVEADVNVFEEKVEHAETRAGDSQVKSSAAAIETGAADDNVIEDDEDENSAESDGDDQLDDDEDEDEEEDGPVGPASFDHLLTLAAIALIEMQQYMDFDDFRQAKIANREVQVDWDDPGCQAAVLRLVLVVEAALLHGRCRYTPPSEKAEMDSESSENGNNDVHGSGNLPVDDGKSEDKKPTEVPFDSLSQALMEMTSDIDDFERRVDEMGKIEPRSEESMNWDSLTEYEPHPSEISTIRTLISSWLHTGQLHRSISVIIKAHNNILVPFYSPNAFLAVRKNANGFARQMKALDGVDVMVETMTVLASPRLDPDGNNDLESFASPRQSLVEEPESTELDGGQAEKRRIRLARFKGRNSDEHQQNASVHDMSANLGGMSTPRHLDFNKNSAFAASLREERDRRMLSWRTRKGDETVQTVHRAGAPSSERELHCELHNIARIFFNGTNVMAIRDAARRGGDDGTSSKTDSNDGESSAKVALLTVEVASNRRRIEVPDDDSSFLLRAQPRALNPVSVYRDDRNHDLSYKSFLATYEEPTFPANTNKYNGGRYIRRCLLQYYPIDRTASIMLHNDARKLDKRKGKPRTQEPAGPRNTTTTVLSGTFLRERHLCQKWTQKGVSTQNFLSSSVMELTDFNATPRSGKALDFIYRMSLFERPTVDLGGKRFILHDSAARGPHRADASALEVSDASLSALLLSIGRDLEVTEGKNEESKVDGNALRRLVEMGPDGYPMIFMKFSRKQGDQVSADIKPYRLSFVRAALLVTSARQEAQLQCLVDCVRAGSAKSATKARTEAQLRPTLKILEFANDQSPDKARASSLLRDLKLGIYHIDREQLRRNGLLNPRNPTFIRQLTARVEGNIQTKASSDMLGGHLAPSSYLYRIRCQALVEIFDTEEDPHNLEPYLLEDGTVAELYKEEWVIFRSMKDFQALHKQLKTQVAYAESSASTGSRLVGAATAAFTANSQGRRQRKALVPSLAQASKTGAIAVTKKAMLKRGELLSEYLEDLLHPGHLLSRCSEVLLFLGAFYPLPPEVGVNFTPNDLVDPMDRADIWRTIAANNPTQSLAAPGETRKPKNMQASKSVRVKKVSSGKALSTLDLKSKEVLDNDENQLESDEGEDMIPSILNKVDQVPLAEVRNRLMDLVRYQFGFENASFFRSRLLTALETTSFLLVTKASDFRRKLYDLHVQQLSQDALADWIKVVLDLLWPDGVWMTPAPLMTEEEQRQQAETAREKLHASIPEQIRAIFGQELTRDGMDMLHEMLQNRLVVKSLFYMLFDLLWIEVFPELRDVLTCASALDVE